MALDFFVLLATMILMLNLLIALMSDQYHLMSEMRIGLYWKNVIVEIPVLAYDNEYGNLFVTPFYFSWLSLILLPFMAFTSSDKTKRRINFWACSIAYLPLALCLLVVFMVVNAVLIPFAYLKTVSHKFVLVTRARCHSQGSTKNLLFFIFLGIPILVLSQFMDAYKFMKHAYGS